MSSRYHALPRTSIPLWYASYVLPLILPPRIQNANNPTKNVKTVSDPCSYNSPSLSPWNPPLPNQSITSLASTSLSPTSIDPQTTSSTSLARSKQLPLSLSPVQPSRHALSTAYSPAWLQQLPPFLLSLSILKLSHTWTPLHQHSSRDYSPSTRALISILQSRDTW